MEDIMKLDLYELLNVPSTADSKTIKKAYRKKALSCHPDKNPDNPRAAELFQQLSKALEVLTDAAARAAYDQVLKARQAAQARTRELDNKRKKLKEDLEAKERACKDSDVNSVDASAKLLQEIERLRKEGSRQLQEEIELLKKKITEENQSCNAEKHGIMKFPRLKARWKVVKEANNNGGYTENDLWNIFRKHGDVTCLVMSSKKRGSAIIEFRTVEAAQSAYELETGHSDNPLTLTWLEGQPKLDTAKHDPLANQTSKGPPPIPEEGSTITSRDYESIVLMKLRQALSLIHI